MITGYAKKYSNAIQPIFKAIGVSDGVDKISSANLMLTKKGPLFLADTTLNIDPTEKELVCTTQLTANLVKLFGFEPKIAMLSFSNFGSSKSEKCKKIENAVKTINTQNPEWVVDDPYKLILL